MTRLLLPTALLLTLVFTVMIALFRAAPLDDTHLRVVLAPDNCAAPCVLGIRPGRTSLEGVRDLLRSHPWIDPASIVERFLIIGQDIDPEWHIRWQWNGQQPPELEAGGRVQIINERVTAVEVRTSFPLGLAWLVLGQPERGAVEGQIHTALYISRGVRLESAVPPAGSAHTFWTAPVVAVRLDSDPMIGPAYSLPCWLVCDTRL